MTRLGLLLAGLAAPAIAETPITVLGDSVLAWHQDSGQSIPDVLGRTLGREVDNLAVPGARLSAQGLLARLAGLDIRSQYPNGAPGFVILDGGGNDLGDECDCDACDATLDTLIDATGMAGEIPEFVGALVARGEQVIWLDYYPVSVAGGDFADCADEFALLEERLERMAAQSPRVTFVDAGAVFDPADLSLYDPDLVHPSVTGAERIGRLLADTIAAME